MTNDISLATLGHFDSQEHSPIDGSISDIICRDVDLNLNNLKVTFVREITFSFTDITGQLGYTYSEI